MKRIAITVLPVLFATTLAGAQAPAGWKVIKEDKAKCQMSVPAEWRQQEIFGKKIAAAASPDLTTDALVNLMDGDWAMFKSIVYSIYTKEKDRPKIEDTPKRLWFEIVTMTGAPGMTSWYVAVPGAAGTCNAQVNFKKGDKKAEELARKVVATVRAS
ncbi:MAG TPA: hypothetical protein VM051_09345 [Usitatibacter sp.]|nr:hypothetical protein [Usitatibacter sp.]